MTDLELAQPATPVISSPRDWSMQELMRFATTIAPTDFVPKGLRDNPAAILACIMTGREMGLGDMEALQQINVIDGRPCPSAQMMRKLVMRAGHRIDIGELTPERCVLRGTRTDGTDCVIEWGTADAMRAGLVGTFEAWETGEGGRRHKLTWSPEWGGAKPEWVDRKGKLVVKDNWQRYPRQMLFARATSELCRALFPDVLGVANYTPDELGAPLHADDRGSE